VNAKIDKESFATLKQIVNIPKEDMEDYHWVMFTRAMNFLKNAQVWKSPFQDIFSQVCSMIC
jgi:hypothetical protein